MRESRLFGSLWPLGASSRYIAFAFFCMYVTASPHARARFDLASMLGFDVACAYEILILLEVCCIMINEYSPPLMVDRH